MTRFAVLLVAFALVTGEARAAPLATVDLTTAAGTARVDAVWRVAPVQLVSVPSHAADERGQPYGAPTQALDIEPHAGAADFDDRDWPIVAPGDLGRRRGNGRVSFVWYRVAITIPEQVEGIATRGMTVSLVTRLDDYAEVWVDGELPRPYGQRGGPVVAGWNAENRLVLARDVRPGRRIQLAIFGMNGPISDAPANYVYLREARLEFEPGSAGPIAVEPQEVNVSVLRLDPEFDEVVPRNPKLFKLAEGFQFTEGPVWDRGRDQLLFSDPNANRIYRWSERDGLDVYREHSGYDGADIERYRQPGSNGLTLDSRGRLTVNEHGRRRVVRLEPDGRVTVLADRDRGRRLNSPNDLVYRSDGTLFFTDPPFGLPQFGADPARELRYSGVYSLRRGQLRLLSRALAGPNGIALSPDERWLYVGDWDPAHKAVLRFPVRADGSVGAPSTFIDLTARIPGEEALDGIKVDTRGHVYLSAPGGVWIFAADGRHLGTIRAPHPVHNFAWGDGAGRTLYLCARSTLYRMPLLIEGVRP